MRAALIAFATIAFALLLSAPLSPTQALGEWRKLGTRTVNFDGDRDTINVGAD